MPLRTLFWLSLFVFQGILLFSQQHKVDFFSVAQGLISNNIKSLFQDPEGRLWIGTDKGVSLFDGFSFASYAFNEGIPTGNVSQIIESPKGKIWVQNEQGLFVYDPNEDHFYKAEGLDRERLGRIRNFMFDTTTQDLWVVSDRSFIKIEENEWEKVENKYKQSELVIEIVYNFIKPHDNEIKPQILPTSTSGVFFSYNHFLLHTSDEAGVETCDTVYNFAQPGIPRLNNPTLITDLEYLNADTLLVGTKAGEIYKVSYDFIEHNRHGNQFGIFDMFLENSYAYAITDASIFKYDFLKKKKVFIDGIHRRYSTYLFQCLIKDEEENIWIGSEEGLLRLRHSTVKKIDHNSKLNEKGGKGTFSFLEINTDSILIGGNQGRIFLKSQKDSFSFLPLPNNANKQGEITGIHLDSQNALWTRSFWNGVQRIKDNQVNWKIPSSSSGYNLNILTSLKDSEKNIWIGTNEGPYRVVYDPGTNEIQFLSPKDNTIDDLFIMSIKEGNPDGNLFFCTPKAIFAYSSGHFKEISGIDPQWVLTDLQFDNQGNMWISTEGQGIFQLSLDSKLNVYGIDTFSTENGLVSNYWTVLDLGPNGNIWAGSESGIIRIDSGTHLVNFYPLNNALPKDAVNHLRFFFEDPNTLWIGCSQGLSRLDLQEEIPEWISALKLLEIVAGEKKYNPNDPNLEIPYSSNSVRFRYQSIRLSQFTANRFQSYLEGVDSTWSSPHSKREVVYTALEPGNYTFWLRERTPQYTWAEPLSISIRIQKPLWQSSWAIFLYIIFSLGLALFTIHYVRERKKIQQAIRYQQEAEKEAQHYAAMQKQKVDLIDSISHELRSPASHIIATADILSQHKSSQSEDLLIIHRASNRIKQLVDRLLDSSKLSQNGYVPSLQTGDLVSFCRKTLNEFQDYADFKKIELVNFSSERRFDMIFDPVALHHILVNLIENSIKYCPEGSCIQLRLSFSKQKKEEVEIEISDNGPGIPAWNQAAEFDKFIKGKRKFFLEKKSSGFGLGLVRDWVEALKGRITYQSSPYDPSGVCFRIYLPIPNRETVSVPTDSVIEELPLPFIYPLEVEKNPTRRQRNGQRKKEYPLVLLIEDDPVFSQLLQRKLKANFDTHPVQNADEALSYLTQKQPDIIVSDIEMPGLDVFDFCQKIKEDNATSHIPIILLTAKDINIFRFKSYEHLVEACLSKLTDTKILRQVIQAKLNSSALVQKKFRKRYLSEPLQAELIPEDSDEAFLVEVKNIVETNYDSPDFTPEVLWKELKYPYGRVFNLRLKKLTGQTAHKYIMSCRLEKAKSLLLETDSRISEIALKCGYLDEKYFSRLFKKQIGFTPREFRKDQNK